MLDQLYLAFDSILKTYSDLFKVETIGDAYVSVDFLRNRITLTLSLSLSDGGCQFEWKVPGSCRSDGAVWPPHPGRDDPHGCS